MERSLPMIYQPAPWQDYEIGGLFSIIKVTTKNLLF